MNDPMRAIELALDDNDVAAAADLAETAYHTGARDPLLFNLRAWRAESLDAFDTSEAILRDGLAAFPDDASLYLALGITLRVSGRLKEAAAAFDTALALDPAYATAWGERGQTFEAGGAMEDAIADYREAARIDPADATAWACLASALARTGLHEEAQMLAQRAIDLDGHNVRARQAMAQIAIEEKRFDDAIAQLTPVLGVANDRREFLIGVGTLLGDAYAGAGRHADAYESYARAQSLFHQVHSARTGTDRDDPQTVVERSALAFAKADKTHWNGGRGIPSPCKTHIVLTGYPRSGTTLVENILASLPDVLAIEERPTLADIEQEFLRSADGLERFASQSEAALDPSRAQYWDRATKAAGEPLAGKLFVDMDPFKGARLPVIARLFPDAKIIIMRRDPREVVWSCFHTNFAYNAGTMAFTSLERTARHYAATWGLIEAALQSLPIIYFDLRYSALVRDFDRTTQSLCAFLGIAWDARVRRFDQTARERGVSTASLSQVRRGLYDGSGSWRPYADYLAMVDPILRPWIDRFEAAG